MNLPHAGNGWGSVPPAHPSAKPSPGPFSTYLIDAKTLYQVLFYEDLTIWWVEKGCISPYPGFQHQLRLFSIPWVSRDLAGRGPKFVDQEAAVLQPVLGLAARQ